MYCPKCGAKTEDDSMFCEECGANIDKSTSEIYQPGQVRDENINNSQYIKQLPNKGIFIGKFMIDKKMLIILITVFVAIISIVLGIVVTSKNTSFKEQTTEPSDGDEYIVINDEEEDNVEPTPIVLATYDFSPIMCFSQGLTWVTYGENSNNKKTGIIDEKGNLIYTAQYDAIPHGFLEDGYSYYCSKNGDVVVDKTGKEHLVTKKEEEESISICGHCPNAFILRKDVKTFSQNAVFISIVDADGNVIFADQEIRQNWSTSFEYYGEGIFRSYDGSIGGDGCFVNINTGAIFKEYSYSDKFLTFFKNKEAYFQASGFNGAIGMPTVVTPKIFESESSYTNWHNSLTEADERQIVKPELSLLNGVSVKKYGSFDDEFAPVILLGNDSRDYFTIVDKTGKQKYEQVKLPERKSIVEYNIFENGDQREKIKWLTDVFYSNGCLIYCDNNITYLIDEFGTVKKLGVDFGTINRFKDNYVYLEDGLYDIKTEKSLKKISQYD